MQVYVSGRDGVHGVADLGADMKVARVEPGGSSSSPSAPVGDYSPPQPSP